MSARPPLEVTPHLIGQRFLGVREAGGAASNPAILAMLRLDAQWPADDSVPWCSAWLNLVCHLLDLPRSRSLRARSWLKVGTPITLEDAEPGFDVVVLTRGGAPRDPAVLRAPGHVGLFDGRGEGGNVRVLGGNQNDAVNVAPYRAADVIGVRRL